MLWKRNAYNKHTKASGKLLQKYTSNKRCDLCTLYIIMCDTIMYIISLTHAWFWIQAELRCLTAALRLWISPRRMNGLHWPSSKPKICHLAPCVTPQHTASADRPIQARGDVNTASLGEWTSRMRSVVRSSAFVIVSIITTYCKSKENQHVVRTFWKLSWLMIFSHFWYQYRWELLGWDHASLWFKTVGGSCQRTASKNKCNFSSANWNFFSH